VDPAFQIVLSKIINRAFQKVKKGLVITGPDYNIPPGPCRDPSSVEICFVKLYVPTARALLATYDFIDFGSGFTNVNGDLAARNSLVLDLNCGLDRVNVCPDPNAFADDATVTIIYGTNGGDTPTGVVQEVGPSPIFPLPGSHPIAEFDDFLARDAGFGEIYFSDIKGPVSGDGTVPLESSIGQFLSDSRVTLVPFTKGATTQHSVAHVDLMFNPDVQKAILNKLGVPFKDPADISTTLHGNQPGAIACAVSGCLNVIFDPVEGFVVDGRGRRLGFSTATGPVTEIPGSVWFGNADGIGWIFPVEEPLALPLTLELTGLDQDYYVAVTVLSSTGAGGLVDQGFLPRGQRKDLPVPIGNQPPSCEGARPTLASLWPPDHTLVAVGITGVSDPDQNPVTITIEGVRQDEPVKGLGDGDTSPDAVLQGVTVRLRAERAGRGDGRVYHVAFRAEDGHGGQCRGEVTVGVPRDRRGGAAIDGGPLYDSTIR
jgi:hypothetical protein